MEKITKSMLSSVCGLGKTVVIQRGDVGLHIQTPNDHQQELSLRERGLKRKLQSVGYFYTDETKLKSTTMMTFIGKRSNRKLS
jgi:hypothetical protein